LFGVFVFRAPRSKSRFNGTTISPSLGFCFTHTESFKYVKIDNCEFDSFHTYHQHNSCFITENVYLTPQLIFAEAGATTNIFSF
jgi:hypothetical protein